MWGCAETVLRSSRIQTGFAILCATYRMINQVYIKEEILFDIEQNFKRINSKFNKL